MKIIIPIEVLRVMDQIDNKTAKSSFLKIYCAFYQRKNRAGKGGYFDMPSTYLKKINQRYHRFIQLLLDNGILQVFTKKQMDPESIFEYIEKQSYDTKKGICKKYRFLIDVTKGEIINIEFTNFRKRRWFEVINNSLKSLDLGKKYKITRDTYGLRVHYGLIRTYKKDLCGRGLSVIDANASHPRILQKMMHDCGVIDTNFKNAFSDDFYTYIQKKLSLKDRNFAKKIYMSWQNSNGFSLHMGIYSLFPIASAYLKELGRGNYKKVGSIIQRKESKIWIDSLLENVPSDFCLPIHDCLIVKDSEVCKILKYCKLKHPDVDFRCAPLN